MRQQVTCRPGQAPSEASEDAVSLRIGIKFLPGLNKPAVVRLEQQAMAKKEQPHQKVSQSVHVSYC